MEDHINKMMYVLVWVNEMRVKAMIDMCPTHNVMVSKDVARFGLNAKKDASWIKPLNGSNQKVVGIVKDVNL